MVGGAFPSGFKERVGAFTEPCLVDRRSKQNSCGVINIGATQVWPEYIGQKMLNNACIMGSQVNNITSSETINNVFQWGDLAVGFALPIILFGLYRFRRISRFTWIMFWFGVVIGLTWELPLHFAGPEYSSSPVYELMTPWPTYPILQPILHASWDGGIFLVVMFLVHHICKEPHFVRFRWSELAVLLVWGSVFELVVELSASGVAWVYIPRWWNPALFQFRGADITLMPQLIWIAAPIVFYLVALAIRRRTLR